MPEKTIAFTTQEKVSKLKPYKFNEELFGLLPKNKYAALKEDIKKNGVKVELHILPDKTVICGHQRLQIAKELGIEHLRCKTVYGLDTPEKIKEYVIIDNVLRRQMDKKMWYRMVGELSVLYEKGRGAPKGHKGNIPKHKNEFNEESTVTPSLDDDVLKATAKAVNTTPSTVKRARAYCRAVKKNPKKYKDKPVMQVLNELKLEEPTPPSPIKYENVFNMDCFDFLKTIENNSIDLILTDPPYEISRETGFSDMSQENGVDRLGVSMEFGEWDKEFKNLDGVIKEFYRVLKPSGTLIIFYDLWKITPLSKMLTDAKFKQLRFIEWIKKNPVPLNSKKNYLTNAREIALVVVKNGSSTFNSEYDNGVYSYPIYHSEDRFHPTQKPVDLFEALIKKHSNKGETVLDCFMGSGTTAIASYKTDRKFKGCEIDKKYYEKMIERFNNGK